MTSGLQYLKPTIKHKNMCKFKTPRDKLMMMMILLDAEIGWGIIHYGIRPLSIGPPPFYCQGI